MRTMPNFSWTQVAALLGSLLLVLGALVALVALGQNLGAIAGAIALAAGALGVQAVQTAGSRAEQKASTEVLVKQTNGNTNDLIKQIAERDQMHATQMAERDQRHSDQFRELVNVMTQLAIAAPPSTVVDIRPISAPPAQLEAS